MSDEPKEPPMPDDAKRELRSVLSALGDEIKRALIERQQHAELASADRALIERLDQQAEQAAQLTEKAVQDTKRALRIAEREKQRADDAERLLRQKPAATAKEIYARYRRRHARNPKVTLKDVCEEFGADYDSIRAAKYRTTKRDNAQGKRHKRSVE